MLPKRAVMAITFGDELLSLQVVIAGMGQNAKVTPFAKVEITNGFNSDFAIAEVRFNPTQVVPKP